MFERIVVPLDGSTQAEAVFGHLRILLHRKDAELILVRALQMSAAVDLTGAPVMLDGLETEAGEYLDRQRRRLENEGVKVRTEVGTGRPTDVILGIAGESQASMIAMTTHGRSGVARWVLGSVTEDVLRRSPIPVLTARADRTERRAPSRILLVPVDGSEESLGITPLVVETARLFNARVAVLRVEDGDADGVDPGFVGFTMTSPANLDGDPDLLDRDLVEAGSRFAAEGLDTTLFRVRGDTASKINHLARVLPADLILMATHGRRGVSRLITGSVAEEVIRGGDVPVLVKKVGAAAPVGPGRRST